MRATTRASVSPRITNNLVWVIVPLVMLIISILMKQCTHTLTHTHTHTYANNQESTDVVSTPLDRYCVMFGKPYKAPSIHTLLKTFMKSILAGILIYLYLSVSGLLEPGPPVAGSKATIVKYVIGLIVLHDYLATLYDTMVGLDVMYFPYELYYVGLLAVCWMLLNM